MASQPPLPPGFVLDGGPAAAPAGFIPGGQRPNAPPSGYRPSGGGLEPIPGGPADPRAQPTQAPSGYRFNAQGALEPIPGGPADPSRNPGGTGEPTEGERRAAAFLRSAFNAARNHDASGIAPPPSGTALVNRMLGPDVMNVLPEPIGNSPDREQAYQRQLAFTNAMLRFESGANAPEPEVMRYIGQYFPGPGASPEATENLRIARLEGIRSLLGASGRGLNDPAGQQLRQDVEAWLANEAQGEQRQTVAPPAFEPGQAANAPGQPTAVDQRLMEPGAPQQTVDDNPAYVEQTDPALAGLNARVGEMFQQRRPMGEVVRYIRERGVNLNARAMARLREIQQFQQANPGYRGAYSVDLESEMVPNSVTRQALGVAAASPVGTAAGTYLDDMTGGHLDNITNVMGGDGELLNLGLRELQSRNPTSAIVGHVGAGASLYGGARAVAGRIAGAALPTGAGAFTPAAIAGDAALGAYIGSGQDGTDPLSLTGAGAGAVGGAAGGIVGRGAVNTLGRAISPSGGEMAPLYRAGVTPTIGQRLGRAGDYALSGDRAEQAYGSIPLLGGIQRSARNATHREFQRGAFNQALAEIGQELPRGTMAGRAAHKYAQRAFRAEFDGARRQMQFSPDTPFGNDLGRIQVDVDALPTSVKESFERIIRNELGGRLRGSGGTLSGDSYIRAISRLEDRARAVRRRPDGQELADALDSVVEAVDDAAARQSPAAAVEQLTRARAGYARLVVIEDAARRRGGGMGEFTPAQFDAAVQNVSGGVRSRRYLAGDALMQDYAEAGQRLGNSLPDSGTPERAMFGATLLGGMGAAANYINPVAALPYLVNTAANFPGARQTLGALMAPNRQQLDPIRQALLERSQMGGLLLAGPGAGAASQ